MNIRRTMLLAVLCAGLVELSGCAILLIGAGAAGGYAISKDSVKNSFDLSQGHVYRQALAVAKQMGNVTLEDEKHGFLRANINDAVVTITVKQITKKTVELKVKARNVMPKIEVAQEVYNKIASRL